MRRSLSIYNGQKARLRDLWVDAGETACTLPATIPYSLDDMRQEMRKALTGGKCCYCGLKLTLKRITADHKDSLASGGSWDLTNLCWCDQSCNWQKGRMSALEFRLLLKFCSKYLSPESAADVKKRLSLGGKWSPK